MHSLGTKGASRNGANGLTLTGHDYEPEVHLLLMPGCFLCLCICMRECVCVYQRVCVGFTAHWFDSGLGA